MKKTNKTSSPAHVQVPVRVFEDASGAPAVLRYNGYAFAFDYLGEIKCNNIAPQYGSRVACEIAKDVCEREYQTMLEAATTPEWRKANQELYAS